MSCVPQGSFCYNDWSSHCRIHDGFRHIYQTPYQALASTFAPHFHLPAAGCLPFFRHRCSGSTLMMHLLVLLSDIQPCTKRHVSVFPASASTFAQAITPDVADHGAYARTNKFERLCPSGGGAGDACCREAKVMKLIAAEATLPMWPLVTFRPAYTTMANVKHKCCRLLQA
jgi:hypothetical protein